MVITWIERMSDGPTWRPTDGETCLRNLPGTAGQRFGNDDFEPASRYDATGTTRLCVREAKAQNALVGHEIDQGFQFKIFYR
jgi:hypothetical protein